MTSLLSLHMLSGETVLLTGFPGFIASRLLRRLAREGGRFLILILPSLLATARQELREIATEIGRSTADFQFLEGDITKPQLGLSQGDLQTARTTTIIFHLAALYDLAVTREVAQQVNVQGTRNVNSFARTLSRLRCYHHISTCYVAGKRKGRILETELHHEAGFRNHYEESKYQAELEVEALKPQLPITIHRPAVVCGDSRTGETAKYDGVYYLIHYLLKWPSLLSLFNIGNHKVSLNLVPVDFVVEALCVLAREPQAVGKTLHLADPNPLTTYEVFNSVACSIKGSGSRVRIPAPLVEFSLMLPLSPAITGLPHHGVPYFFLNQTYDTTEAGQLLRGHGIECPPFRSYVRAIVDFAVSHPVL